MTNRPDLTSGDSGDSRRSTILAAALIAASTLLVGGRGLGAGGLGWSDAPLHTMDGALLLSFFREWPVSHLRAWLEEFYLRHPSIGLIVYYPPGFAAIEAAFFAVAGVGVAAARACVLAHAAVGAMALCAIGRRWLDGKAAVFAALLMLTSPHGALWLHDVMLEWPALCWIAITVWLYLRYMESGRGGTAWLAAAAYVMAVMTKQTAGFIGPVLLVHALFDADRRRRLARPAAIVAGVAAAFVLVAYYVVARRYAALPQTLLRPDFTDLYFYFRHLGETAGWPIVALAVVGLWHAYRAGERHRLRLSLLWFGAWVAFSSLIAHKEPRYFFFALPPLTYWAAACARVQLGRFSAGAVIVAWVIGLQALGAVRSLPRHLPRYDDAVQTLLAQDDADLVLVDAVRDGQFVLDAFVDPVARERLIPLRANKLMWARAARERFGYRQLVNSPDEIAALLDRYGIHYVLMESALPVTPYVEADPPPRQMLRTLVADRDRFELVASWPLRCADRAWNDVELRLYRYTRCPPRTADRVTLPMPSMGGELTLPLPPRKPKR